MKHRNLRIAWSIGWVMLALSLCVLWVRSYWWIDVIGGPMTSKHGLSVASMSGCVGAMVTSQSPSNPVSADWTKATLDTDVLFSPKGVTPFRPSRVWGGFYFGQFGYVVPNWFCILICALLACIPWLRQFKWQFSLRTLLIATTLVAVALGTITWISRAG